MAKQIEYGGWPNCYCLSNERLKLIVTTDVGPRVIWFGLADGENAFKVYEELVGRTGDREWVNYGGHRLWHAPEAQPRTYCPDNGRVEIELLDDRVCLVQPLESSTGIQKELEIQLLPGQNTATITHRLHNRGLWPVALAPWALSVMAPGGIAVIPLPPRGSHGENLLPTSSLALWAYTDLADRRYTWGRKYILMRQDSAATTPQKIGLRTPEGWLAYVRNGLLFAKSAPHLAAGTYPDRDCNLEVFTDGQMLELETLGPMSPVEPGACVTHRERWILRDGIPTPSTDEEVDQHILPVLSGLIA